VLHLCLLVLQVCVPVTEIHESVVAKETVAALLFVTMEETMNSTELLAGDHVIAAEIIMNTQFLQTFTISRAGLQDTLEFIRPLSCFTMK